LATTPATLALDSDVAGDLLLEMLATPQSKYLVAVLSQNRLFEDGCSRQQQTLEPSAAEKGH